MDLMKKTSFIATGDAFITRRFPEGGYEGFEAVSYTHLDVYKRQVEADPS